MTERELIDTVLRLACAAVTSGRGGPFGAVVVLDGRIIGRGENRVTSENDPTAHAEVIAVRNACREIGHFELLGAVLYASCEPCPMCLGAAYWARVEKIVFAADRADATAAGFDDAFIYDEILRRPDQRRIETVAYRDPAPGFDALAPFRLWREKEDKIRY